MHGNGVRKTVFALDLLESHYKESFAHIVILCPMVKWDKAYQGRRWIWTDPVVYTVNPGEWLHDWLWILYGCFAGEPTLYIIDDSSGRKALTKKKDMLSEWGFSGRHMAQSIWILMQKFNAILKDFREQVKFVAIFFCKDRDSFEDCLHENDVIPSSKDRAAVSSS